MRRSNKNILKEFILLFFFLSFFVVGAAAHSEDKPWDPQVIAIMCRHLPRTASPQKPAHHFSVAVKAGLDSHAGLCRHTSFRYAKSMSMVGRVTSTHMVDGAGVLFPGYESMIVDISYFEDTSTIAVWTAMPV
jgi:hypothetical protein